MKSARQALHVSLVAACLGFLGEATAAPPNRGAERIWTGVNGATFTGVYARTVEQGGKIEFLTSRGKIVTVAFGNLCEKDQNVILTFEGRTPGKKTGMPAEDAFKELPRADRNLFPERNPEDFGGTDDESIVDALWVGLLWWNAFEVVPIPKTGDFDRKAEWLHEEITRYIARGGKGAASLEQAREGVEKYFTKRLEDIGTCRISVIKTNLHPTHLSKLATGNNIVVIQMGMTYENGNAYSVSAVLENMTDDGDFSIQMFGKRFRGKMVENPGLKPPTRNPSDKTYDLTLNDRNSLPEYYMEQGARFHLIPGGWDGFLVLEPFVYKTPGEPSPIPSESD